MPSPEDPGERKLSRRRFMKSAGLLLAAGVVGAGLGDVAVNLLKHEAAKEASRQALRPSTTAGLGSPTRAPMYRTTPIGLRTSDSNPFSIFWITDTQFLSEANPLLFQAQVNWIVNNWRAYNGKLVIHTGDIVQQGGVVSEWQNAHAAMSTLSQNGIPYTWCAGNHDDFANGDPTSGWIGNASAPAFDPNVASGHVNSLGYTTWAGDHHQGMNTAATFTANGLKFLVVNIEWLAQPDALAWVGGILDNPAYADHHVIVAPHAYMDYDGNLDDAKWGTMMAPFVGALTPILNNHPNVFLTLNGHFATDCGYNTPSPIITRNQLMFDRQDSFDTSDGPEGRGVDDASLQPSIPDASKVGGATVMVLTFNTISNLISTSTFDVYTGMWRDNPEEQYTFTMFPSAPSNPDYGQRVIPRTVIPATIP